MFETLSDRAIALSALAVGLVLGLLSSTLIAALGGDRDGQRRRCDLLAASYHASLHALGELIGTAPQAPDRAEKTRAAVAQLTVLLACYPRKRDKTYGELSAKATAIAPERQYQFYEELRDLVAALLDGDPCLKR